MTSFRVETQELTIASAMVVHSGAEVGGTHSALKGSSGALGGTAATNEFEDFVAMIDLALIGMHKAVTALSTALNEAAVAYQVADQTTAAGLAAKHP